MIFAVDYHWDGCYRGGELDLRNDRGLRKWGANTD